MVRYHSHTLSSTSAVLSLRYSTLTKQIIYFWLRLSTIFEPTASFESHPPYDHPPQTHQGDTAVKANSPPISPFILASVFPKCPAMNILIIQIHSNETILRRPFSFTLQSLTQKLGLRYIYIYIYMYYIYIYYIYIYYIYIYNNN